MKTVIVCGFVAMAVGAILIGFLVRVFGGEWPLLLSLLLGVFFAMLGMCIGTLIDDWKRKHA